MKTCSVDTCDHPAGTRGYCSTHYSRVLRYGDPRPDQPIQRKADQPRSCKTGCGKTSLARGLCATHYMRWRTTGDEGPAELLRVQGDPDATEKRCTICGETKPIDEFYTDKRTRDGRGSHCKGCFNVKNTDVSRRRKYGISTKQYDEMHAQQGGRCAVCGEAAKLVIDHCHRNGNVRALLCDRCNRLLGVADDDIELMRKAIAFLQKHSKEGA